MVDMVSGVGIGGVARIPFAVGYVGRYGVVAWVVCAYDGVVA